MRKFLFFFYLASCSTFMNAQHSPLELTLQDALLLGQSQSLQSLLVKHNYLVSYWQFKSFKANYLPSVNLYSTLASYNNSSQLRYNSVSKTDEFVNTRNLSSDAEVIATQRIGKTGGSLYAVSDLGRINNYGDRGFLQYSAIPFRFGYSQDLLGFNSFKWEKEIEPLKLDKAKRELAKEIEEINLSSTQYYFSLAMAQLQFQMALQNQSNIDTLLKVAKRRFELGSIGREDLLDLQLSHNNFSISVKEAELALRDATEAFKSFFMLPPKSVVVLNTSSVIPSFTVDADKALEMALHNNPVPLQQNQFVIESARNVDKAKAAARLQASLSISYGMSKNDGLYDYSTQTAVDGNIQNVYKPDFDSYQTAKVDLKIPIANWGSSKGNIQMAISQQQVTELAAKQTLQKFEQNVVSMALSFNIQKSKVDAALLSDSLATASYLLTVTRFMAAKVDVLKLSASQQAKDNARYKYLSSLAAFWYNYFSLRGLTLYDFERNRMIQNFSDLESGH